MSRKLHHNAQLSLPSVGPSDALRAEISSPSISNSVSHQNSKIVAVSAKLSWKIEQFERLTRLVKNNKSLVSDRFFSAAVPNVVWELHMYPNGKREEDIGNVSFFLRQIGLENTSESLLADFQIYVVDAGAATSMSICRDAKEFTNQQGRGKFQVQRDRLMHYVHPDGKLHLCCDVEYLPWKCSTTKQEQRIWEVSTDRATSVRDMMVEIYNTSLQSDFEIHVNGQVFRTHRCFLSYASEVFESMFKNGMRESTEGHIKLTDTTPSAVRAMLEYIYTGIIERTLFEKNARDILIIAEKYNIVALKEECESYLSEQLTTKSFTNTVMFADMYSCENLMDECRRFLLSNYDQLTNSRDWTDLKRRQPAIVNEILEKSLQDKITCGTFRATSNYDSGALEENGQPEPKRPRRTIRGSN
ncbi:hypothetical protein M3Y94_00428400 [Aphelenchoides besseyi]|nr:hypothetical protein M3Y94_00428400 [Aphelenchoides besseyi]KAI6229505.1 hypothetical protein M3Y95_00538000 [Aphelenchoides besseyi]